MNTHKLDQEVSSTNLYSLVRLLTVIIIITVLHLNPSFVIDTMWEIPKTELRHGAEIAKGQCGVSIIEATLRFAFTFTVVCKIL